MYLTNVSLVLIIFHETQVSMIVCDVGNNWISIRIAQANVNLLIYNGSIEKNTVNMTIISLTDNLTLVTVPTPTNSWRILVYISLSTPHSLTIYNHIIQLSPNTQAEY